MDRFSISPNPVPTSPEQRAALTLDPLFGTVFTDHMVTLRWSADDGWHDGRVEALAAIPFHPGNAAFHYGQQIFEGLKVFRGPDGDALLFRPRENARRMQRSAARLAMQCPSEDTFIEALEQLVLADADWIPEGDSSLYLRPFIVADEVFLGMRAAANYLFCVIASPVGPYFSGGNRAIDVWVSETFSRAARGGTGAAKCGGNYAASLVAQVEAVERGCDQVVFLDAAESRWIEELGGMNIFFVMHDGEVITPPLGTILPGVTRDCVMTLASAAGHRVVQRRYALEQWRSDAESGRLAETFVCGTAATVVPIGHVHHGAGRFTIANGACGPLTAKLRTDLQGIQRGRAADPYGWRHPLRLPASAVR